MRVCSDLTSGNPQIAEIRGCCVESRGGLHGSPVSDPARVESAPRVELR